ncbi:hypothetical protein FJ938_20220 [Mesorhizobium sp. B2-4-14]|nr:hypothetical protein FJ938_20220 [Mesorhizobium sp. B2-4-14]
MQFRRLEHDAEKCEAVFGQHHALLFDLEADSDFRSNRPQIIRLQLEFRRNLYDNRALVNTLNPSRFLLLEAKNVGLCATSAARAHRDRLP